MIVLIDGVRYKLITPQNEAALEKAIQSNCEHIFGPHSFYFDKKKLIKSKAGVASIPDGYVIFFDPKPKWCILEVELASHQVYDHLIPQLTKFNRGIEDASTRRKLVDMLYTAINQDEVLKAKLKQKIGSGELHKFIYDLISEDPLIVVAIDQKTEELEDALRDIRGEVKAVEFMTFRREGITDQIHAYAFAPIVQMRQEVRRTRDVTVVEEIHVGRGKISKLMYALFDQKGVDNVTYEECKSLAQKAKADTKFNKRHFYWYKNKYRKRKRLSLADTVQRTIARGQEYGEDHHLKGKPQNVIDLFRTMDRFCKELGPTNVHKKHLAKYIRYSHR